MTITLWCLAAFIGLLLLFNRKSLFRLAFRFLVPNEARERWSALATRQDVAKLSATTADAVIAQILAKVTEAAEAHFQDALSKARAELLVVRKQLSELRTGWVTIGIQVRGFKLNEEDKRNYYALIQISPQDGQLRAHPESGMRKLIPSRQIKDTKDENVTHQIRQEFKGFKFSSLGSPWYGRVQGDTESISMLGETYTVIEK